MTRAEHLAWCKQRALLELDQDTDMATKNAVASMLSDLRKHEDTADLLAVPMLMNDGIELAGERDVAGVRRWIEGF